MLTGEPSSRVAPDTSRNASSSESGSTSGVTAREDRHDLLRHCAVQAVRGGITAACGQSLRARDIGIAERTPNARAS